MNSLSLANFKAFGPNIQEAKIKPITLVFGANSSGKSSLMHSLLWLNHSLSKGTQDFDVKVPTASKGSINLGGFNKFVNRLHPEEGVTIGWNYKNRKPHPEDENPVPKIFGTYDYDLSVTANIAKMDYVDFRSASVIVANDLLLKAHEKEQSMLITEINFDHVLIKEFLKKWASIPSNTHSIEEYTRIIKAYIDDDVYHLKHGACSSFRAGNRATFYNKLRMERHVMVGDWHHHYNRCETKEGRCQYFNERLKIDLSEDPDLINIELTKIIDPLLFVADEAIQWKLEILSYITGLRELPDRDFDPMNSEDEAWKIFASEAETRKRINDWLGSDTMNTPYRLDVRRFVALDAMESEDPPNNSDLKYELSICDINSDARLTLHDVGLGISQIVPVLIHAIASRRQTVCIEQPEIHIHPALQAEMGDVFIESALGENENTFVLETHSEHLILRILRRIRETSAGEMDEWPEALREACPNGITPEDVSVLYIGPGDGGSQITQMEVTPDGDFIGAWPGGFFAERSKELF